MKKIKLTLFIAVFGLLLVSCKSDISEPQMSANPTTPVLKAVNFSIDFNADNAGSSIPFNWTAADYGFQASINTAVEMDVAGNNFANAVDLVTTNSSTASISVKDFNTKLLALGLPAGTVANVEFRLKSNLNNNLGVVYSNTVSNSVTPYRTQIFMIGEAVGGWDLAKAVELPVIAKDVYEATTQFNNGGHFRFFRQKDWSPSWGYDYFTGSVADSLTKALSDGDPNYIFSGRTGNYKITVDLNNKSIALKFISEVQQQKFPSEVFLVGTMNGWNNNGLYIAALKNDVHVAYQYLDSDSKFKILIKRGSWDGAWGTGSDANKIASGGGDIVVANLPTFTSPGFYEIRIDFPKGTVVLTPVTMGVIGDAQAGGWDKDVDLTYNAASKMWEGQVTFLGTGKYKFRANHGWGINFGGSLDNLVQDGSDINTPGAGTYNVKLDLGGTAGFSATVSQ